MTKTKAIAICAAFGAITILGFSGAKSASAAVPSTRLHQTLTAGIMDHHDWDRDHDRNDRWRRERAERLRRELEEQRRRARLHHHHDNGNHNGWWNNNNNHNNHHDWDRDRDNGRDRDRDRDWDHDRR